MPAPPPDSHRCNTDPACAGVESVVHTLSAGSAGSAAPLPDPSTAGLLVSRNSMLDSREGPWEVIAPRSSAPGGDATPLRGANLRLTRKSTLYLKIWREASSRSRIPFSRQVRRGLSMRASCFFPRHQFLPYLRRLPACVICCSRSALASHSPPSSIHGLAHTGPVKMAPCLTVINMVRA
jgi:hypothetical protein